ncbi:hypothetical protein DLAC_02921 [Tieghemostelium lacteum]|uniref:DUF2804 domain-containing protein n=1 Tax=Tieghemostelium lacteum TaxID=361077 RepID=A0A152A3M2_TIELA|nr:hypothetical protein DLAC_02921 [Tieghemostelium lacteum]|eukprot:KYR00863.1 hypothetical protein DLAC_02921 [Tieghemostelium lacteum]
MSKHIPFCDENLNNQIELRDDEDELLDEKGRLKKCGWSRHSIIKYNPNKLSKFIRSFRLKEWNYYSIGSNRFYFAVAAVDLGYLTNYHTFFVDFKDGAKVLHDEVITPTPFSKGLSLPSSYCELGDHVHYNTNTFKIEFTVSHTDNDKHIHNIKITSNKIKLRGEFKFDLSPNRESVVLVTPIGKQNFYYNKKTNLIPVQGSLEVDGQELMGDQYTGDCYGIMDWGRGVWDYSSFWIWSSAWGTYTTSTEETVSIGLNFGSGFGNLSTHTENAINVNGKIHKLGHVDIVFNEKDHLQPWKFTCKHGRFGESPLVFTPFKKKYENNNFGLVMSSFYQILGKFTGELLLDSGERVNIDLYGFSEVHSARW